MPFPLDDLRTLEAIVRLGSAAAAARELGVATSTVYRRIATLEASLGVRCIARGDGVTEVGRELAAVAGQAHAQLAEVVRRATATRDEVRGKVALTTVAGFAPLITDAIVTLSRSYPQLRLELHVSDRGLSVRDREADIALSVVPNPPPQLVGRKIARIGYAIFGTHGVELGPDTPWIVLAPPMHNTPQSRWEAEHVRASCVVVATGARLTFLELVRRGVGLGVLPLPLGRRYQELREVDAPASLDELQRPAWLLTHPELRDTARISVVLEALSDALS